MGVDSVLFPMVSYALESRGTCFERWASTCRLWHVLVIITLLSTVIALEAFQKVKVAKWHGGKPQNASQLRISKASKKNTRVLRLINLYNCLSLGGKIESADRFK